MFTNNIRQPDDYLMTTKCPKCGKEIFYTKPKPDKCPECGAPIEKNVLTRLAEEIEKHITY